MSKITASNQAFPLDPPIRYHQEKTDGKTVKGSRFLLLENHDSLESDDKTRLDFPLAANRYWSASAEWRKGFGEIVATFGIRLGMEAIGMRKEGR